jgi:hypothetical protein
MMPFAPTVRQAALVGQLMPYNITPELDDRVCQVTPSSVLARMVPVSPTARQVLLVGQAMLSRLLSVPEAVGRFFQ